MSLDQRITATRKARGMSMSTLADLCGVSTSAVSNWESGNSTPREESLARLARSLGVTREYLETGTAGASEPMDIKSILDRAKLQIAAVSGVSPDQIKLNFQVEA